MAIEARAHFRGESTQSRTATFFSREFGRERDGAKLLGRLFGRSHRTAQKWIRGEASPSADAVVETMRRHPKFRDRFVAFVDGAPSTAELVARAESLRAEIERLERLLAKAGEKNGLDARSGPECRAIVPERSSEALRMGRVAARSG